MKNSQFYQSSNTNSDNQRIYYTENIPIQTLYHEDEFGRSILFSEDEFFR